MRIFYYSIAIEFLLQPTIAFGHVMVWEKFDYNTVELFYKIIFAHKSLISFFILTTLSQDQSKIDLSEQSDIIDVSFNDK